MPDAENVVMDEIITLLAFVEFIFYVCVIEIQISPNSNHPSCNTFLTILDFFYLRLKS